jgi:xeroderma pigmentosum group C-complementing protein
MAKRRREEEADGGFIASVAERESEDDDESDESIDWEDVDLAVGSEQEKEKEENKPGVPVGDINVTLNEKVAKKRKESVKITKKDLLTRFFVHLVHVQCLLYHGFLRNSWLDNRNLQLAVKKQLPKPLRKEFKKLRSSPDKVDLLDLLERTTLYFRRRFKVTAPGLRRLGYMETKKADMEKYSGETFVSFKEYKAQMLEFSGSRDLGAQLFTCLMRAMGLETRLVFSLPVLGHEFNKNEKYMAAERDDPDPDVKRRIDSDLTFPTFWSEVLNPKTNTYVVVDPLVLPEDKAIVSNSRPVDFEPKGKYAGRLKMRYVVGYEANKNAKNLTPKYINCTAASHSFFLKKEPKTVALRGSTEADQETTPQPDTSGSDSFFLKKEPKTAALRNSTEADQETTLWPDTPGSDLFFLKKEPKTVALRGSTELDPTLREADPGGLGASPQETTSLPDSTGSDLFFLKKEPKAVSTRREVGSVHSETCRQNSVGSLKPKNLAYEFFLKYMQLYIDPSKPATAASMHEDELIRQYQTPAATSYPSTLSAYKGHPTLVLFSQLHKDQVLRPSAVSVHTFQVASKTRPRTETVYLREDVLTCRSDPAWRKEGRVIKKDENPLKTEKFNPTTKRNKRKFQGVLKWEDRELEQGLYSFEQTEPFRHPPIIDGIVPTNEHGTMECFTPEMVPENGVHLRQPGIASVAKKLSISYAPAVTGFSFQSSMAKPTIEGVIVAQQNKDLLLDAWKAHQTHQLQTQAQKASQRALKKWASYLAKLRLLKRLKQQYND